MADGIQLKKRPKVALNSNYHRRAGPDYDNSARNSRLLRQIDWKSDSVNVRTALS